MTMLASPSVTKLYSRAKAAKAAGNHTEALTLLDRLLETDFSFAPASRMRQTILQQPNVAFTYTQVLDFLASKNFGFHDYFPVLEGLIKKFDLREGVELGVLHGYHAQHLVEACPYLTLYGVDAFRKLRPGNGYDDVTDQWFETTCQKTRSLLEPSGRWHLVRKTTTEAAAEFRASSRFIDFVFIDADHSYESVKEDFDAWYPLIRPGGLIAGHDFNHPDWPGVQKAVEEKLAEHSLTPTPAPGHVWYAQKPNDLY